MKRHLAACARGTPLGFEPSGANRHDSKMLAAVLDVVPGVRRGRGRPRRRPKKLHADKAYDHRRCRTECRERSITPRIARRGVERSDRLGRHRWVVERTLARLARFRRLTIRHERRATSTGPSPRWPAPSSASTRSGSFVRRSKCRRCLSLGAGLSREVPRRCPLPLGRPACRLPRPRPPLGTACDPHGVRVRPLIEPMPPLDCSPPLGRRPDQRVIQRIARRRASG